LSDNQDFSSSAHGGKRPGAGRVKGVPNKATACIKAAASEYSEQALQTLAEIMAGADNPAAARVGAANAILDRAYGKPKQSVDVDANVTATVSKIVRKIVDPTD
jgi:hypothetical protein